MKSDIPVVAVNAHLASQASSYRSAGISGYIVKLVQHLPLDDEVRYLVLTGTETLIAELQLPTHRPAWSTARPFARILWEQLGVPWVLRRAQVHLLHAPAFGGPILSGVPHVDTVHDLSFLRYPSFFPKKKRLYLRWLTRLSCRRAAAVIAVSQFTAQEVIRLLGVPASRVHVIYHGVEPRFRPLPDEKVRRFRQQQRLPERFILYLGTLEPRKNLITLVRAYAGLADPDLHLVLAGGKGWLYEDVFAEVERLGVGARVHVPGYVPDAALPLWYNAADVFAYLSWYEGFGLPVLEALACGVPTVASQAASLPEVAGDAALLAPPDDVSAVRETLRRALEDETLRARLRSAGPTRAAQFTWEATAEQTVQVYKSILGVR
ncbi:MAG: glycosyltransferase family 4 protein [Anaerolineae bacterium]